MNQPPDRQPAQKQYGEAVKERGAAIKAEFEIAKDRPDLHALQPVVAAGDRTRLVRRFTQQRRDDKGLHQESEASAAQDHKAAQKAHRRGGPTRCEEAGERLAPAMRGKDSGSVGAGAEKRRLAQRDDTGIAQHQIGRQCEQDRRQDLRRERQVAGKEEIGGDGDEPRQGFVGAQAMAPGKSRNRRCAHIRRANTAG